MRLCTAITLSAFFLLSACAEDVDVENSVNSPGLSLSAAQSISQEVAQAQTPKDGSVYGIVELAIDNSGLNSVQGSVLPAGVFNDQPTNTNISGVWDITGPWDSIENDVAYLEISINESGLTGTSSLYDYDNDEAGSGMDCFFGPFTGSTTYLEDFSLTGIDGPYPLNGMISINGDDNSITLYMLDLLDIDEDEDFSEIIEYQAVRSTLSKRELNNPCAG